MWVQVANLEPAKSLSHRPLWFVVYLKGLFPKNSFKTFVEDLWGKMKILRAVDFHTIGGANGSYLCRMDDVVFRCSESLD